MHNISLQDQESLILSHTHVLIDELRTEIEHSDSVNVTGWLVYAAFDIARPISSVVSATAWVGWTSSNGYRILDTAFVANSQAA